MDGPVQAEEDFSSLSISDRLSHKNWKARVNAYESLVKAFQTSASDTDPVFKPYISNPDLLKKIATDANAVAQEKGLECLVALIKYSGETSARTREAVVPALVEKAFGSARAGTKNHATELVLQYVEVENSGSGVANDLLVGLSAKQPKTVAGCVTALREVIRIFGTQVTLPAPLLKALPKIFAHSDKTVRADGTSLALTLYKSIGPSIEPWLSELKPVQLKELKEAFEILEKNDQGKGTLKQERLTRKQAHEAELRVEDFSGEKVPQGTEPEDESLLDPRASAEPVDIVAKMPSNFKASLTSSKWKERKEVLDELLTLCTATLRIKDASELGDVARSCALCVQKDANIACVVAASSCIEALAKGIQSPFGKYREGIIAPMLERLKERKASVTDVIGKALDAVFHTTNLTDIIPDLLQAMASKNPQVKESTLKFFGRCLATSPTTLPPAQIKVVADHLAGLLDDGFEGARNEAAVCLGTLMKMVGERPLNAMLSALPEVRRAKVTEAFEKATVRSKGAGGISGAAPKLPVVNKPVVKPGAVKPEAVKPEAAATNAPTEENKTTSKPLARLLSKKQAETPQVNPATKNVQKKVVPVSAPKPSKTMTSAAPSALETFKYKHTPEEAELMATEMIPSQIVTDLVDANWKVRLAALDEMTAWTDTNADVLDAEVIVRALAKKGWNEKNFQVSAKLYGILVVLAEKCPSFGRSCVALCVAHLLDKIGDMKLKKAAGEALLSFAERTSLQLVLCQAYDPLSKQKAPKVIADAIAWIESALLDFGIAGVSLRALIDCLKTGLKNSNAVVRTSATKAMVTVKLFAGSSIKDFLEDLNAQLLATIDAEFTKAEGKTAPTPTRISADLKGLENQAGATTNGASDPLDELYPRVEVDALLKGTTILADSKSDAWKTKKEALETLQAILEQGSNKRLKPQLGEIGQVLKARVTDSNKAVQALALDIVACIATGMGKPFEKQSRFFALPVATVLSDQKANVRSAAIHTLTCIATACEGIESMVHGLGTALESSNPVQKHSLLQWIASWFAEHGCPSNLDLNAWAGPIVVSLDDRSGDVRKAAQAVLPSLISCAGFEYVMQQTSSLKPASKATAVPLIQAAKTSISSNKATTSTVSNQLGRVKAEDTPIESTEAKNPSSGSVLPSKPINVRRKLAGVSSHPPEVHADSDAPSLRQLSKLNGSSKFENPTNSALSQSQDSPFFGANIDARKARLGKDVARWINDAGSTKKELAELLHSQMEQHVSKDLLAQLFSRDHNAVNDNVAGMASITQFYVDAQSHLPPEIVTVAIANFDLPLKYVSMKAHEPQSNITAKCLDVVDAVLAFLRSIKYQLTDPEALCFIPTFVYKLGDPREPVRLRTQQIIQSLPKVYSYSRMFQVLLEYGLKSKVAKTRQGTLDELGGLLKRFGMGTCEPAKAFPVIATLIADKDASVRKSALGVISEGYSLVGDKIWTYVGTLSPKDKTQLEERLRRVEGPSSAAPDKPSTPITTAHLSRLAHPNGMQRPGSPVTAVTTRALAPRAGSPALAGSSKLGRPSSPAAAPRAASPSRLPHAASIPVPNSPSALGRQKSLLPSRLGPMKTRATIPGPSNSIVPPAARKVTPISRPPPVQTPEPTLESEKTQLTRKLHGSNNESDEITITISSILSSDALRSVDALKKVQKILSIKPEDGSSSEEYQLLADHTEGLIETITLQMAHVFDRPAEIVLEENFRLAKHLIQTLNNFCDHAILAESLTVDILTSLLEELTIRLLETDESGVAKVKDLSRFINMIILRLFATGRRMSIFRGLFTLLLQIVKPFPANSTLPDSKDSKVAELVLKCIWKLARNIPQDLKDGKIDPVELFPAIEHFLQSIPPNEWRARATNGVPCGDMPLRTIKVIIQHVVAHHGDEVYDLLSGSFDDPSATIVYPYVYRILNSNANARAAEQSQKIGHARMDSYGQMSAASRPVSPLETVESSRTTLRHIPSSHRRGSPSTSSNNGQGTFGSPMEEPDLDAQLTVIIGHISSETTGALHKEGITELHHYLKAHPEKASKVDKLLDSTGAAFRKYINRALASRATEDKERNVAVADTLSKLEATYRAPLSPLRSDQSPRNSRQGATATDLAVSSEKLSRLHDIFQYRSSVASNGSSHGASRHPS